MLIQNSIHLRKHVALATGRPVRLLRSTCFEQDLHVSKTDTSTSPLLDPPKHISDLPIPQHLTPPTTPTTPTTCPTCHLALFQKHPPDYLGLQPPPTCHMAASVSDVHLLESGEAPVSRAAALGRACTEARGGEGSFFGRFADALIPVGFAIPDGPSFGPPSSSLGRWSDSAAKCGWVCVCFLVGTLFGGPKKLHQVLLGAHNS